MTSAAVFDVDGTICFDGRTIAEPVLDALRALRRHTRLVFASARPIRDLLPVLPPDLHDTTLVGGNGAFARDRGRTAVLGIAHEDRLDLDALIDRWDLKVLVDGDWDYAFTGDEAHRLFRQLDAGRLARNVSRHEIADGDYVAFGNDANDVLMLRHAAESWCVGRHEALGFADHHIDAAQVAEAIASLSPLSSKV